MFQRGYAFTFFLGLVIGAGALYVAGPPCKEGKAQQALVDGKFLVVQNDSGHWIYEKGDKGLQLVRKEISTTALKAIWELQSAYHPQSIAVGGENLLSVTDTAYSTESGQFRVLHKFFRLVGGKLVEAPMESANASGGTPPPAPVPTPVK